MMYHFHLASLLVVSYCKPKITIAHIIYRHVCMVSAFLICSYNVLTLDFNADKEWFLSHQRLKDSIKFLTFCIPFHRVHACMCVLFK